ncbi:MAG: hypothetical protein GY730_10860 [bacterium]|nr:hypothetical protein [bacterium]
MNKAIRKVLRGFALEVQSGDGFIVSKGSKIYRLSSLCRDGLRQKKLIMDFPLPLYFKLAIQFRLLQRLLRLFYYNVIQIKPNVYFVSFARSIAIVENGHVQKMDVSGETFRVLRQSVAIDQHGDIYFGEYKSNKHRGPVRIFRIKQGTSKCELAYEFPEGIVRHIHGVYFDQYENTLYCSCGDIGDESRIIKSTNGFRSHEIVGTGNETWRAVSLQFTKTSIYYAMDAEFEQNYVFEVRKSDGHRRVLGKVDGPVFYSFKARCQDGKDHVFFQVTAEGCPSQEELSAKLYEYDGRELKLVEVFKKDMFSKKYFMYGTLHFPNIEGNTPSSVYLSPVAISKVDNTILEYRPDF